jgi:hypothetical protein
MQHPHRPATGGTLHPSRHHQEVYQAGRPGAARHTTPLLAVQVCVLGPLCSPVTQIQETTGSANDSGQSNRQAPEGGPASQIASQQGMCSLDGRYVIERHDDQRLRWSEPMWSPPPESNRRPHPYHGTTKNRCAHRHLRRSRPTVGAEVIGSPSAQLCGQSRCRDAKSGSLSFLAD